MSHIWDGVTRAVSLTESAAAERHDLADAGRRYDWHHVLQVLLERPDLVNCWRPDGRSWFAPLHQVAHGGASIEVAREVIDRGAWRTLRSANGERPVDIATRRGHAHLGNVLAPRIGKEVDRDVLKAIQHQFHGVIRTRAADLIDEQALRLPELEVLLEREPEASEMWFPVPGMYGGFKYRLVTDADGVRLVSESWIRIVGGSGQLHEITAERATLVDEGFV